MQMNQRLVMRNQFAAGLLQHSAGHHVLWLRITEPLTDNTHAAALQMWRLAS